MRDQEFPLSMTVNNLRVTLYKYPGGEYKIAAQGFGWSISYHYRAEDWRPQFYAFIERIMRMDVGPKPHPQNETLF